MADFSPPTATPLWTPPASPILDYPIVWPLCMGLAGACHNLTFPLFVGAPLLCTASRRGRNCVLRWGNHQAPAAAANLKGADAATLKRVASTFSGSSGNPLQPEPPRVSSRSTQLLRSRGGPGENKSMFSPGGFGHFRRAQVASRLQKKSTSKENAYLSALSPPTPPFSTENNQIFHFAPGFVIAVFIIF